MDLLAGRQGGGDGDRANLKMASPRGSRLTPIYVWEPRGERLRVQRSPDADE